jgi:monodehydroascorbate reductase (NADH)
LTVSHLQAVVVGGGYIGLECAAALQMNDLDVTIVFPEGRFMERLFTPEIADFYEKFYADKGIKIISKDTVTSFEGEGKVRSWPLFHSLAQYVGIVWAGVLPSWTVVYSRTWMSGSGKKSRVKLPLTGYSRYTSSQIACDTCQNAQETFRLWASSRLRLPRLSKFGCMCCSSGELIQLGMHR